MFCFEFLRIFGEKSQKLKVGKNLGKHGLLCHGVGNPRRSMGCPRRSEAEGAKMATLGYSKATPRHRHYSQRGNFRIFGSEHLVFVHDSLGTLIND